MAGGKSASHDAAIIGDVTSETVRQLLRRFNREGLKAIEDRPRPGRPAVLSYRDRINLFLLIRGSHPSQWRGKEPVPRTLDDLVQAARNEGIYARPIDKRINRFLGVDDWRERWQGASNKGISFRHFLVQEYANQMRSIGYKRVSLGKMKEVRSDEKNLPLYHLAFFSKHDLGYKFWDQVLKYGIDQQSLPGIE